jgi:hypothetical protein
LKFYKKIKIPNVSEKRRGEKWERKTKTRETTKMEKLILTNLQGKNLFFLKSMKNIYLKR